MISGSWGPGDGAGPFPIGAGIRPGRTHDGGMSSLSADPPDRSVAGSVGGHSDPAALVVELRSIVEFLDERNAGVSGGLPAPSVEYLLFGIARLLESIARAAERSEPLPADVVDHAVQIARHAHRYLDQYRPTPGRHDNDPAIAPPEHGTEPPSRE